MIAFQKYLPKASLALCNLNKKTPKKTLEKPAGLNYSLPRAKSYISLRGSYIASGLAVIFFAEGKELYFSCEKLQRVRRESNYLKLSLGR